MEKHNNGNEGIHSNNYSWQEHISEMIQRMPSYTVNFWIKDGYFFMKIENLDLAGIGKMINTWRYEKKVKISPAYDIIYKNIGPINKVVYMQAELLEQDLDIQFDSIYRSAILWIETEIYDPTNHLPVYNVCIHTGYDVENRQPREDLYIYGLACYIEDIYSTHTKILHI